MTLIRLAGVASLALVAAACSSTTQETRLPANSVTVTSSQQACLDYGFRAGTDAYNRCVVREADVRARGRVAAGYAPDMLAQDAANACYSYGLTPGTATYDRCVGREMDARRYTSAAYVTPSATYPVAPAYPVPASSTTTTYGPGGTTTIYTTTTVPTSTYPPATTPPAGVEAFRDEYGFRYDGQGNRLDRNGNIISPQSTIR